MNNNFLTNDQIIAKAPSIAATRPQNDVSDLYTFVPTITVVNLLAQEGWFPVSAEEIKVRVNHRQGFQKHMIKFENDTVKLSNDESIQAILVNSHDRSCAFNFFTGVFRFVCSNGMVLGDTFEKISVKHINHDPQEIIEASYEILDNAPAVAENIEAMKALPLNNGEKHAFAKAAHELVYDDADTAPFKPERLLWTRRGEDNKGDLWHTFNTTQENIMKGGIRGISKNRKRRIKTKPVKSIDRNLKLNKALWTLAEEMKKLKS